MAQVTYTPEQYNDYSTYSKYGYVYLAVVTFLDGTKAYKIGYTNNPSTRFKSDNTIHCVDFQLILPHVDEHHRGLPESKYQMWEALAHKHTAFNMDYSQLTKFRDNLKATRFSGYSECYPFTQEADDAIVKALLKVNECMQGYTDNVWFN
ncbi:hypothetical protein [Aeromonas veronii]|uniref:hypothetical protein n=1 Tax=Aeromonas veronii TaxID=654 RepID=UPI00367033AE